MKMEIDMTQKETIEYLQMDLIPPSELEILAKNVEEIKESSDKVRKGMFKRHSELAKKIEEVECRLDQIEKTLKRIQNMFAQLARNEPAECGPMDISPHSIKTFVMSVDASQLLPVPEIGNMQIMGKIA